MTEIERMIQITANGMLDKWAREAQAKGLDAEIFIGDQLDILEETDPEVRIVVGRVWLARLFAR